MNAPESHLTTRVDERPASPAVRSRIAVLMTCFNRKQKTLECLDALFSNTGVSACDVEVFLVDDGSTDGTDTAVKQRFAAVKVFKDNGNLFWCRGMYRAFEEAWPGDYDHYVWLNDDTTLYPDALARLLACESGLCATRGDVIVVGTTVDATTGVVTYGGERRVSDMRPLRFTKLAPSQQAQRCDSMNGNFVLVPRSAARSVGNLDWAFEHAMGDTDYALRAGRLGVEVWAAPGVHGTCSVNPVEGTFVDGGSSLRKRWKNVNSRKGLPWRSWLTMTRRHGGVLWPALFVWPYLGVLIGRYGRK